MNRFSTLALSAVAIAASVVLAGEAARAQEIIYIEDDIEDVGNRDIIYTQNGVLYNEPDGLRLYDTIYEEFEDRFFANDENYYNNRSIPRQVSWLFGVGFVDNEITADGDAVHDLYVEVLEGQSSSTPRVRTPDLENPYSTSLLLTPISEIGRRDFDNLGFRQPIGAPQQVVPQRTGPVPALW
ncbi:MAG: hypothetical protein WBA57_06935 [Elainellaceae cyanobacterium]